MLPCNISHWFKNIFTALRLEGCSSYSGRRTFITNAARRIIEVRGIIKGCPTACWSYIASYDTKIY